MDFDLQTNHLATIVLCAYSTGMNAPLLYLDQIFLNFGGTPLLEGAELSIHPEDRICLVGRNGSGKSTLMKIAAGLIEADKGERFVQPGTRLHYLEQEPDLSEFASIEAYVESGLGPQDSAYKAGLLIEELGLSPDTPTEQAMPE